MTQIIVDPSEMRRLARMLEELRGEMLAQCQALGKDIHEVRGFWDDEKYAEFVRRTDEITEEVVRFADTCDSFLKFLNEKARRADVYLGR